MMTNEDSPVRLRAIEPEDIDLLYDVENDRSLWMLGNTNVPYSKELLRSYILGTTGDIYTDKQLRLIIEADVEGKSEPVIIGMADLVRFDPRNSRAEVGIVILNAYRRHGYASYVLERLSAYAKDLLHLHQLYAIIPADNRVSRKLFAKCGFNECAQMDDWIYDGTGYKCAVFVRKML